MMHAAFESLGPDQSNSACGMKQRQVEAQVGHLEELQDFLVNNGSVFVNESTK